MSGYDGEWGTRRPATRRNRARKPKPYNDDYKDDYSDDYSNDYNDDYRDNYRNDTREGSDRPRSRRGEYDEEPRRRSDRDREDRGRSERSDRNREDRSRSERPDRNRGDRGRSERSDRDRGDRSRSERSDRNRGERSRSARSERDREDRIRSGGRRKKKRRGGGCGCCLIPFLILLVLIVLVIAAAGFLWSRVKSADFRSSDILVNSDLPESVTRTTKDYHTIMVFGVDSRDNDTLQAGTLADSNIIITINKKTGDVKMVSIYRDTYVETTQGETMKLTEVYSKYGAKEQLQTINKNFDMNVTEYVTLNWKSVAETINELDGIDVELTEDEASSVNKYIDEVIESTGISSEHIPVQSGTQHLDGVQAVTYCRLRKGLGDDYKRTERQRTVISLTLAKAQSAGILKTISVCNTIFPGLSSSLSLTDIMTLALGLGTYNITDSTGFPFESVSQDGGRYYIFPNTLASNTKELHAYLYNNTEYEPSGTVSDLSASVSAYSGYYGN